jgi:hypothetical protein
MAMACPTYELMANNHYVWAGRLSMALSLKAIPTEKDLETAYQNGEIDSMNSVSPDVARDLKAQGSTIYTASLPRVFGVFFNQDQNPA